ncbi:MAG: DNA-binding protein [Sphingobacteriia bacterium]|nr:DNA-binding protein [Sphingobacteriia bacterium]
MNKIVEPKSKYRLTLEQEKEVINFIKLLREESKAPRKEVSIAVCKTLFFDYGIQPTINLVYSLTKFGSMSDIGEDVKEFWEKVRTTAKVTIEANGVPEDLQSTFGQQLSLLWFRAMEFATQNFTQEKERLGNEISTLFNDLSQAKAVSLIFENRAAVAEEKTNQVIETLTKAEQVAHDFKTEARVIIEQLKNNNTELQKQLNDLKNDLIDARKQFSDDLSAERKLRFDNEAYAKDERSRLLKQVDDTRQFYEKLIKDKDEALKASRASQFAPTNAK